MTAAHTLKYLAQNFQEPPKVMMNIEYVKQQVANLMLQCPELADDEQLRSDMIEGETEAFDFLHLIERKRQDTSSLIEGLDLHITVLRERLARLEHRERCFRNLEMKVMDSANLKRVELPQGTLSIQQGRPKIIITDESIIPDELCRFTREPDKKKIGELLKNGALVRGAEISNTEPVLTIRIR